MQSRHIVAKQYEAWAYPAPVADMEQAIKGGYGEQSDISYFGALYWPARTDFRNLRILIAGCGTNQAAYHAIRNPQCKVVGIDLSTASLAHTQYLKEKHKLQNLALFNLDLLSVGQLGEEFDMIICTGVLHHLTDPDAGLRALKSVLKPDGIMSVMLYGATLRHGVYLLQEAFRLMGLGQEKTDVETVRAVLKTLPAYHTAHAYMAAVTELQHDAAVVDTFLHRQDRAYTVPEIFTFADVNGMSFVGWHDRMPYSVRANFAPDHPAFPILLKMDEKTRASTLELLTCSRGTHRFILCHAEHYSAVPKINFDNDDFLNYKPKPRPGLKVVQKSDPKAGLPLTLKRGTHEFTLSHEAALLLGQANGQTPIRDMLKTLANIGLPAEKQVRVARSLFDFLHETGHYIFAI